jgi:copper chaperone CopZ
MLMKKIMWILLLLLAGWVTAAVAAGQSYQIQVDGLACPFCTYGIEKELSRIDNVENVETRLKDGVVIVTMVEGAVLDEQTARNAIEKAGFTPRSFERIESVGDE